MPQPPLIQTRFARIKLERCRDSNLSARQSSAPEPEASLQALRYLPLPYKPADSTLLCSPNLPQGGDERLGYGRCSARVRRVESAS